MALPPNVSEAEFAAALAEFAGVVGEDWVFSSDEDVALYRDSYSIYWNEPEERVASAALAPANVEEVQQIVRIANRFGIPLYPISTGRNLTYGGSAPNQTGSVVLDLKRMNRILEVNEDRNFALVEPGVSYFDLYNYIQERGLNVMIDVPDPGWGSPVGNSLDHGVGYTMGPYRDHFGAHCGMEFVTPEGDVVRTGMGALPDSETWQDYRYGVGPTVDGLLAQSNFGIVTKMGFWLMPQPETFLTGTVTVPRYSDFAALVKEVNYLEDSLLIGQADFGSPANGGGFGPPSPGLVSLMQNGWPSVEQLEEFVSSTGQHAWSAELRFYGPEEVVRASWEAAKRRFAERVPGAAFHDGHFWKLPVSPETLEAVENRVRITPQLGVPALEIFDMVARNPMTNADPWDGHADFFAFLPRTADAVHKAARVMFELYTEMGAMPFHHPFSVPIMFYTRAFTMVAIVPTWRDPVKNAQSRALYSQLIDRCAENGWGAYRTSPAFQDQLVSKYSYNDAALLRYQEKLKDSIDPNGIISPGRYGIWPANMRSGRA